MPRAKEDPADAAGQAPTAAEQSARATSTTAEDDPAVVLGRVPSPTPDDGEQVDDTADERPAPRDLDEPTPEGTEAEGDDQVEPAQGAAQTPPVQPAVVGTWRGRKLTEEDARKLSVEELQALITSANQQPIFQQKYEELRRKQEQPPQGGAGDGQGRPPQQPQAAPLADRVVGIAASYAAPVQEVLRTLPKGKAEDLRDFCELYPSVAGLLAATFATQETVRAQVAPIVGDRQMTAVLGRIDAQVQHLAETDELCRPLSDEHERAQFYDFAAGVLQRFNVQLQDLTSERGETILRDAWQLYLAHRAGQEPRDTGGADAVADAAARARASAPSSPSRGRPGPARGRPSTEVDDVLSHLRR